MFRVGNGLGVVWDSCIHLCAMYGCVGWTEGVWQDLWVLRLLKPFFLLANRVLGIGHMDSV